MTHPLGTIADASHSLQKLIRLDLPLRTAHRVMMLTESLNPHLRFFETEIQKCRDSDELAELRKLSVDIGERDEIEIPLDTDIKLTATDVALLRPFINFS